MHDMNHYLDHRFAPSGERRLMVAATRFEDGTYGPTSMDYHQQRGRLLRSLADAVGVETVEFSEAVDDADTPHETGNAYIDVPVTVVAFASSMAGLVAAWVSLRPRKKKDSVPGIRLELPGRTLILTGEVKKKERVSLVKAFLEAG